jgi:hypothetical protein
MYDDIDTFFGIIDENPKIKVISNANVFSTNVFIPMDNKMNDKSFFYLTGMVKLIETFKVRIENSVLTNKKWMLFIYYDHMFEEEYNDDVYEPNKSNNDENRNIKENYEKYNNELKILFEIYKNYISIIKKNENNKYDFIKLYSYNCKQFEKKKLGYLGHPSTFGSFIRFIPLFNPNIERVFLINISQAITPIICYLIEEWTISNRLYVTNYKKKYIYEKELYDVFNIICNDIFNKNKKTLNKNIELFLYNRRPLAGLYGFYKNKYNFHIMNKLKLNFIKIIDFLIDKQNKKEKIELNGKLTINWFFFGIDELILGMIIKQINILMNIEDTDKNKIYFFTDNDDIFYDKIKPFYLFFYMYNYQYQFISNLYESKKFAKKLKLIIPSNYKNIITIDERKLSLNVKYEKNLFNKDLQKIKTIIYKLKNKILNFFYELGKNKKYKIDENLINFIDLTCIYLFCSNNKKPINCDITNNYFKTLRDLELYDNELLFFLYNTYGYYRLRYISIQFMKKINHHNIILDFLEKIQYNKNNILILTVHIALNSYDEIKPLIIINDKDDFFSLIKYYTEYYTFINYNDKDLLSKILNYYTNPEKVLPIPYNIKLDSTKNISSKTKTKLKTNTKLKTKKKSKQRKNQNKEKLNN